MRAGQESSVFNQFSALAGCSSRAPTACRYIRSGWHFAVKRLEEVLMNCDDSVNSKQESALDNINMTVLRSSIDGNFSFKRTIARQLLRQASLSVLFFGWRLVLCD
jgi:hypothetical protein